MNTGVTKKKIIIEIYIIAKKYKKIRHVLDPIPKYLNEIFSQIPP